MSLTQIAQIFFKHIPTDEISRQLQPGKVVQLQHFVGSTASLALADISRKQLPLIVITPNEERAQFIRSDIDALGATRPLYFPPSGMAPYDSGKVRDTAVSAQRSDVIDQIRESPELIVVTSAEAIYEKMASPDRLAGASISLRNETAINPDELAGRLVDQHYQAVSFVNEPGEFARRGGILDIYPFSGEYPVRIEFFGDEINSIREFDPDSQRSVAFLDHIRLVPNLETFSLEAKQSLITMFPESVPVAFVDYPGVIAEIHRLFADAEKRYSDAAGGNNPDGNQLGDGHSSDNHSGKRIGGKGGSIRHSSDELEEIGHLAPPETRYLAPDEFVQQLQRHPRLLFGALTADLTPDYQYVLEARPQPDFNSSVKLLRNDLKELSLQNIETWILCDNDGQRKRFEELLGEPSPYLRYHLSVETLHRGFILPAEGIAVYTDHQIFNRYHRPKTRGKVRRGGISFKELKDLNIGDYVVHVDHGIGKFSGFRKIKVRDVEQEAVVLKYQNDSILYVNVSSLHKLQKYSGKDGAAPKITTLGSGEWSRKKAKAKKRVKDIARDLIELYAKRKSQKAYAFSADNNMQTELEASFIYEETPDQEKAIEDVKADMMSETPMDRLVCGDVGFGKTEVAVRAAFKSVLDGKQVAVMVPTTILADQHWKTFSDRMKDFAVNIDVI
ncbi:MAG: CarD family transcriptional regulator, partial [Balneolales bacterium]